MLWLLRFLVCFGATISVVALICAMSTSLKQHTAERAIYAVNNPADLSTVVIDVGSNLFDGQEKDCEEEPQAKLFALVRLIDHAHIDSSGISVLKTDEFTLSTGRQTLSSLFRPPRS